MAKRPLNKKAAHRVRKLLRSELPAYIDLIQWLKDRGYADTTGQAEKIILAGRVRSGSHKLGMVEESERKRVYRRVPAKLRGSIHVVAA